MRRKIFSSRFFAGIALATSLVAVHQAAAQSRLGTIRDAEIESLLRDYARPLFKAAGLSPNSVDVILVQNRAINAFVSDGRRIFIFTGLLTQTKTPNEVIGVLAHEIGHIAGGHLAQSRDELRRATAATVIATLLGAAAAAGGALSGSRQATGAGMAIMQGGRQIAQRGYLQYARVQESSADQAAARYLRATGQSAKGMLTMFSKLADQMLVSVRNIDPYAISHPLPRERISLLERLARDSPYFDVKDPAKLQLRHDMMLAKLLAFTGRPDRIFRRYKNNSLPARYARAIALYRSTDLRRAIKDIDALIAENPKYPYFWELKGQALLESGKARQAVPVLKKAVSLAPRADLIRIMYAQALLQTNTRANLSLAIGALKKALVSERRSPFAYRQLAMAYGKAGNKSKAELASAQEFLIRGDLAQAKRFAKRATKNFKAGTRDWLIADDILKIKGR